MPRIFLTCLLLCLPALAQAQSRVEILSGAETVVVPVPQGYETKPRLPSQPENLIVFRTRAVEPWETAGAFEDELLLMVLDVGPGRTEAEAQDRFEALHASVLTFLEFRRAGADFVLDPERVSEALFSFVLRRTKAAEVTDIFGSQSDPFKKSVLFATPFDWPDAARPRLLHEVSFVRLDRRMVLAMHQRADPGGSLSAEMTQFGETLRDSLSLK